MIDSQLSNIQLAMREAIQNIAVGPDRGRDISREHAALVMEGILDGVVDEVQAAIFLIALRMKRESMEEFSGILQALKDTSRSITSKVDDVLVLADPFDGYARNASMTPFIPAVLAVNELNVVLHGVESVGPKYGVTAQQVYARAGAEVNSSVEQATTCLEQNGCCYLDQSQYAPKLYALNDLRGRIIKRSALTTLERILCPLTGSKSTKLALGYVHKAYPEIYSKMAFQSGYDSVLLFKGVEGGLAPALNKPLRRYVFDRSAPAGLATDKQIIETEFAKSARTSAAPLPLDESSIDRTLDMGMEALNGKRCTATESLVFASANILSGLDGSISLDVAVEKVWACLDNGSAEARFDAFTKAQPCNT